MNGGVEYSGQVSQDAPNSWKTLARIIGEDMDTDSGSEPKIIQVDVIGSDEDHTIFGLGKDGKPYVWQDGVWIVHA